MTNGEAHFRSRTAAVEEIYLDAVCRENVGGQFGELARVVAHIMANGHAYLRHFAEGVVEVVGQTLGGSAHGVDVHAVGAGAHYAAQTASAKFQVFVKGFYERGLVGCVEH